MGAGWRSGMVVLVMGFWSRGKFKSKRAYCMARCIPQCNVLNFHVQFNGNNVGPVAFILFHFRLDYIRLGLCTGFLPRTSGLGLVLFLCVFFFFTALLCFALPCPSQVWRMDVIYRPIYILCMYAFTYIFD